MKLGLAVPYNLCVTVCHVATFGGALEEQAEFMSEVGRCVDVPVILSNQIASFDEVVH